MMISLVALLAFGMLSPDPPHFSSVSVRAPRATLHLQVADTPAKREFGLMYRHSLLAHTGMVFVFKTDALASFWMKNTLVPLDMVFIAPDGRVRRVFANVPASTLQTPDDKVARRDGEAKFVLELPPGEAASDGLEPGARVTGLQNLVAQQ